MNNPVDSKSEKESNLLFPSFLPLIMASSIQVLILVYSEGSALFILMVYELDGIRTSTVSI